jgi:hypothetical protein
MELMDGCYELCDKCWPAVNTVSERLQLQDC